MAPNSKVRTDVIRVCLFITVSATVLFNWQREGTSSAHCCEHVLMWVVAWYVRQNISGADIDVTFLEQLIHKSNTSRCRWPFIMVASNKGCHTERDDTTNCKDIYQRLCHAMTEVSMNFSENRTVLK